MSSDHRYICIHGHFYQPPRENPWLDEIELQDSAYPYHDWNERVNAECYARNAASRILDNNKKIIEIINNYAKISFNFGPTLLSWMQRKDPETYKAILEADQLSQKRFSGHGSAMAQVYNHMIMPLANSRDKRTQILWGIKDFEHRFNRKPEGMWLAETAVDLESLDIMAECGIKFTILAPHQAKRVKKRGDHHRWKSVLDQKIDPKVPYVCHLPSGRQIAIFFYDGPVSQAVAFQGLLHNGEDFARRLIGLLDPQYQEAQVVNIGTDGETYGHHHKFGDMALAYSLHFIDQHKLVNITIYSEFLEKYPPTWDVEIIENTSWSCFHGVERWRENCGCHVGTNAAWTQQWRKPLREALDWLRDQLIPVYEREMLAFTRDPWAVRDAYIEVILNRDVDNVQNFFKQYIPRDPSAEEKIKILKLLEIQLNAMLMYTSCGWFFDEISGIETVQILRYAARVMQLAREITGTDLENDFLKILKTAKSNRPELQNGAIAYEQLVKTSIIDLLRVGAHYAMSSLFEDYPESITMYSFNATSEIYDRVENDNQRLAVGKAVIQSMITWEETTINFAVLHLGDHNLIGGVALFTDDKLFGRMYKDIKDVFKRNDIPGTMSTIEKYFETGRYSLWHLFKDEQTKILYEILDSTLEEIESSLRRVNAYHYPIIQVIKQLRIPLPKVLANTVLVMLNKDLVEALGADVHDFGKIEKLVAEVYEWSLEIDRVTVEFVVKRKINQLMLKFEESPFSVALLDQLQTLLRILTPLSLNLDYWKAQNIYYTVGKKVYTEFRAKSLAGDESATHWVESFNQLGNYLQVKIS